MKDYLICTVQRSGKTWLCKSLACLGYGRPEEYLHMVQSKADRTLDGRSLLREYGNHDFDGMIAFLRDYQRNLSFSKSKCVGLAIQWNQLETLARQLVSTPKSAFLRLIQSMNDPVIFYLKRNDALAQAISHYIMNRSNFGHSYQDPAKRAYRDLVEFNEEKILEFYDFTMKGYKNWDETLNDVDYAVIEYESIVARPEIEIEHITEKIFPERRESKERIVECAKNTKKIADNKDYEFRERILASDKFYRRRDQWIKE